MNIWEKNLNTQSIGVGRVVMTEARTTTGNFELDLYGSKSKSS